MPLNHFDQYICSTQQSKERKMQCTARKKELKTTQTKRVTKHMFHDSVHMLMTVLPNEIMRALFPYQNQM